LWAVAAQQVVLVLMALKDKTQVSALLHLLVVVTERLLRLTQQQVELVDLVAAKVKTLKLLDNMADQELRVKVKTVVAVTAAAMVVAVAAVVER
jgi:hypothetical protein